MDLSAMVGALIIIVLIAVLIGVAITAAVRRVRKRQKSNPQGGDRLQAPPSPTAISRTEPAAPRPEVTPGVFISYRREDESNFAGRLYERLLRSFETSRVFMDVDSIELGLDFQEVIDRWLEQCSVMLVVIGNKWLDCTAPDGSRRLDNPDDFVRIEVASALARPGVRVIPVLVDGASVPSAAELPDPLKPLARRNALTMSHAGFGSDFERLHSTLQRAV